MSRFFWSEQQIEMLKNLVNRGYPIITIRQVFVDRSEESIRAQIRRLGLSAPPVQTQINMDLYQELVKNFETKEIS